MMRKMSSSELTEWIAYSKLEFVGISGFDYSRVKLPDSIPMSSEEQTNFFLNVAKYFKKKRK